MIYEHLNIDDLTFNYSDGDKSIAKVHFVNRDRGLINGISCDKTSGDFPNKCLGLVSPREERGTNGLTTDR